MIVSAIQPLLQFWGKARPDRNATASWHPAALHSLDVAAVAAALLEAHPERAAVSARACGWPVDDWVRVVIFLVALHDVGKFSRAFQAMVEEAWPKAVLGAYKPAPKIPHDHVGFQMLASCHLSGAFASVFPGWEPSWRRLLLGAVAGHHGRPVLDNGSEKPAANVACEMCLQVAVQFIDEAKSVLDPPALSAPALSDPDESKEREFEAALASTSWWLAGLTVVCDWLGSSQRWFPYWGDRQPATLQAYWKDQALPCGRQAVAANGLLSALVSKAIGMRALQPDIETPSPVQQLVETIDLPDGPTCLLIEDVTGSGKTEAALVAAHRLMAAGRANGIFVALPTMATADAMFARVAGAYRRLFASDNPSLALAHGKASLNEAFTRSILRDAARQEPAGQDAADQSASAQCAAWLADDRRLAFLADIGVGTIDQALLAVLSVRHAPLRLHGLARKVLVIDEAHAYDAYMSEELSRLLQFHAALGGSSIVLSATLPRNQRAKLLDAFRQGLRAPSVELTKSDYPLVTLAGSATCEEVSGSVRPELTRTVPVSRLDDVESCVAALIQACERGACCVWVRNTVDDVLAAAEILRQAGVEPIVFHARFAMGDRLAIQDRVLEWFGKGSTPAVRAPGGVGRIVVSSQVIEQSLDLDFDFMITDLAPVDLLIQRAGRLWRHRRDRPLNERWLAVLSPEPSVEVDRDWAKPLGGTRHIYSADVLWRSARALFAAGAIHSPGNVRDLVEAVYGDAVEPVPGALIPAENESEGKDSAARGAARAVLLDLKQGYQAQQGMWDPDIKVSTRLGDAQTQLRLAVEESSSILPICRHDDPTKAWSLSEISVRRNKATGARVASDHASAIEAIKAGWPIWERELPVVLLRPEGGAWTGELEKDGRTVPIRYDRRSGLRFT